MPKVGIEIPTPDIGEDADISAFVAKWRKSLDGKFAKRHGAKSERPGLSASELAWIALCACKPYFLHCERGSIGAAGMRDDLGSRARADRLMGLFSKHPDEAARFWEAVRAWRRRRINPQTRLALAREAVRGFAFDRRLAKTNPSRDACLKWAKKYASREGYSDMVSDIEGMFGNLPKPNAPLLAKTIEAYLNERYGGEWSATVEDAIQAERGHVSGKNR